MSTRTPSLTIEVGDTDQTRALGEALATQLRGGDLLLLSGGLGAGKTTFTQGLGQGLGVRGRVSSPTFIIARVHPSLGSGPDLVHVDAYRIDSFEEVDALDLDTSLDTSVTVVEWGEGKMEGLAEDRLDIRIDRPQGEVDGARSSSLAVAPDAAQIADDARPAAVRAGDPQPGIALTVTDLEDLDDGTRSLTITAHGARWSADAVATLEHALLSALDTALDEPFEND